MVWLEALSYLVTILGFPIAIYVFIYEQRRSAANEEKELHRHLSEEYDEFLRLVMDNSDLLLLSRNSSADSLTDEQLERRGIIFQMLVSLFEKAYIILYEEGMDHNAIRRWQSWEDDMREWCRKEEFRLVLPDLLEGEDGEFSKHIQKIARLESQARPASA